MNVREKLIQKVFDKKIVAIVRGVYDEDCVNLAQALCEGGIELLEVTFDQSKPEELTRTSDTIRKLVERLGDRMIFGAGTVTTIQMLELAKDAGARFIVSPDTNEAVIRATVAAGMVSMPGALTPTEVVTAHAWGADFVKLFPAGSMGTGYVKAVTAPINHIPILAVGGITEKNVADFLAAGAVGVGVGGNLVNKTWIKNGEFDKITAVAREFVKNAGL
jgi:2-dehydro-3-deoxyphosphogluconate aldolase/(4S)-4-hydroxy-2-oxoglutarate aldolase